MAQPDLLIVGGGIIGLATGYQFTRAFPGKRVVLLEKEPRLALHQTGRNSGVLHSGIYYRPGSLRATFCQAGKAAMEAFCRSEGIAYEICGKLIVALSDEELPRLQAIHERGLANGVRCELIERERLREIEPHAAGLRAIHVPETGIADYPAVCEKLAAHLERAGGQIVYNARVAKIETLGDGVIAHTSRDEYRAAWGVACAGLFADRVARQSGEQVAEQIVPFRGEYYELKPEAQYLCRNLIYPVPDPAFPFLGVHFTRLIHGGIECGPNAVLAFAREGYRKRDVSPADLFETLTYPGFLRLAGRYWRTGLGELRRSFSKRAFVRALQRLIPELQSDHLVSAPSGVRAQIVTREGTVFDDWMLRESERVIHVLNAPSPAATASLSIGQLIVDKLVERWK